MTMPAIPNLPINPELTGLAGYRPNITYAVRDGRDYTLDLFIPWQPEGAEPKAYPTIVFIQGSAWTTPDRLFEVPQLGQLAQKGFVVASVGHRSCLDGYMAPAFLQDVKTAIRFLRAHAAEYAIDPQRIGAWGTSSGGNTALLLGVTGGMACFETDEYADQSSEVQLVVDCFGPADLQAMVDENYTSMVNDPETIFAKLCGFPLSDEVRQRLALISPYQYVEPGKNYPPFLLLHGSGDPVVDYTQSTRMYEKLLNCGYEAEMYCVPGAPHEGSFWSQELIAAAHEFIIRHLA